MRIGRRYRDREVVHTRRTVAYLVVGLTVLKPHNFEKDLKEVVEGWGGGVEVLEGCLEYLQFECGAYVELGEYEEARRSVDKMIRLWKARVDGILTASTSSTSLATTTATPSAASLPLGVTTTPLIATPRVSSKSDSEKDKNRIIVAYSSLMRGILHRSKRDSSIGSVEIILGITTLFQELKSLNLQPTLFCYTPLMTAYYKYGGLTKLVECYNEMLAANIAPDQAIYNILIRAYTLENLSQNAMDLFDEMVAKGLYANVRVLTSVMATLSLVGDMESCVRVFEQIEACGVKPDHALFHVVMSGYAQACDVGNVLTWYNHLLSAGLRPDTITYTIVMLAISRSSDPEATRRWFDRVFSSNILPNVYTYSLLIHDRTKAGDLASAVHIYRDLVKTGIRPTSATFTMLINAHIAQQRSGSGGPRTAAGGVGGRDESFQRAVELCHEMMTDAARPDVAVFHVMMKMFSSMGRTDESIKLFERLKSGGIGGFGEMVEPDETMYMSAIVGYAALENLEKLEETLREMLMRGAVLGVKKYPPVMVMQTVLYKLSQMLWKRDSVLGARVVALFERLFREFLVDREDGLVASIVMPTPELFEKLIRVTARNSNVGLAVLMYVEMTKRGFSNQLESVTRTILFEKLAASVRSASIAVASRVPSDAFTTTTAAATQTNVPSLGVLVDMDSLLDAFGASVVSGTSLEDAVHLNQALEYQREQKLLTSIQQVDTLLTRLEDTIKACTSPASTSATNSTFNTITTTPASTISGFHLNSLQRGAGVSANTNKQHREKWGMPSTTVHILLDCFNESTDIPLISRVWRRLVYHACRPEIHRNCLVKYVETLSRHNMWDEVVDLMTVQCKEHGWYARFGGKANGDEADEEEDLMSEVVKVMRRYQPTANATETHEKAISAYWIK
ncbi:UNVERIFIED_CONTAM: hypothetical protein HDU68_009237 [Siphonaria sp. JEL0065]|nr:hypothetical protein HDU68_009237 [Siphonaria sp. JEL0065]